MADVVNGGPTLNRHYFNASYLLGWGLMLNIHNSPAVFRTNTQNKKGRYERAAMSEHLNSPPYYVFAISFFTVIFLSQNLNK